MPLYVFEDGQLKNEEWEKPIPVGLGALVLDIGPFSVYTPVYERQEDADSPLTYEWIAVLRLTVRGCVFGGYTIFIPTFFDLFEFLRYIAPFAQHIQVPPEYRVPQDRGPDHDWKKAPRKMFSRPNTVP